ncbi:MAG TPA: hypothetical protein VM008_08325 [Phycisphaerae bacterium]|nr:hypothetical protein [Phycisphaerae bacterium]
MKYRVLAHSKDTGQKITLEFEARSKADAERRAKPHNVNIIRIEPAEALPAAGENPWTTLEPRRSLKLPWILLFLALAGGAIYYFSPTIRAKFADFHPPTISRPAATTAE